MYVQAAVVKNSGVWVGVCEGVPGLEVSMLVVRVWAGTGEGDESEVGRGSTSSNKCL